MAVHYDREHFIPLRCSDMIAFLCEGRGSKDGVSPLSTTEVSKFREFSRYIIAHYHNHFNRQQQRLKDAYAPFDPDADTITPVPLVGEERNKQLDQLFQDIHAILLKANYRHLSRPDIQKMMEGASAWGLEMVVDWDVFERLEVYYRGDSLVHRTRRKWWKLWKKEEVPVEQFNRMVLVLKQKPHKRLGKDADVDDVFLKIFKDIPKCDLEMVLPGTRIRWSKLDQAMIFYPLLMAFFLVIYKVLDQYFELSKLVAFASAVTLSFWPLMIFLGGYAYRSYYSYSVKKTTYTLQLTQSLYYQSIDGNAGVFYRIFDEAEEQESREALLAYYYLWKYAPPEGWTPLQLDDCIEQDFERRLNIKFDFEINDALDKLQLLNLVQQKDDCFIAIPIEDAIQRMKNIKGLIENE